jgi:nicotinate-nucleotide pyrophosphorylase (carboxylating)
VLIKENHIRVAGGIHDAVSRARAHAPHSVRIEVEVTSMDELEQALSANADIILLDNFSVEEIPMAVSRVAGQALLEVSGGVKLDRVAELASAGVDVISVGALTHSAPASDISLDLEFLG